MDIALHGGLEQGVRNLLLNCAQVTAGQRLLLVHETEAEGYYDPGLVPEITCVAHQIGLITQTSAVALNRDVSDPGPELQALMQAADCTVFLARLGDQIRFHTSTGAGRQIILYALDRDMLASPFGTVDYAAFEALKQTIDQAIARAGHIHVTCPAGTDFEGGPAAIEAAGDVTRTRFPMSVHAPVPAQHFAGRVAQKGFLTGTGSCYYMPYACEIKDTLFVDFDGTRITGFDGAPRDVAAASAHYDFVAKTCGTEPHYVHSWHTGIHPGCCYTGPAGANFERWSGCAFGNPRLLHFHTCGAMPPGEISLNVLDPTVRLDGVAVWEGGVLHPNRVAGGAALLERFPDMAAVFAAPARQVGQSARGQLAYR